MSKKDKKKQAQKASQLSAAERAKLLAQQYKREAEMDEATSIIQKAEEHRFSKGTAGRAEMDLQRRWI